MPSERLRHGRRSRSSRNGHRRRISVSPVPRRERSRPQDIFESGAATRSKAPPPPVPPKLTINVRPDQIKIDVYDTATLSDPHVQSMFQAISMGSQSALSAPAQPILQMTQRTLPSRESMRPKAPALPMWAQGLPSDLSSLPPPPRTKHVYKMDDPFSFTWTAWGVPWKVRKDRLENTCLSAQFELTGKDFMVKSGQPFLQEFLSPPGMFSNQFWVSKAILHWDCPAASMEAWEDVGDALHECQDIILNSHRLLSADEIPSLSLVRPMDARTVDVNALNMLMFRSGFAGGLASVTQEQVAPLLESLYYFEGWKNRLTEVVPLYRQDQLCGLAVFEAYTEPVQMKLHPTGALVPFVKMFPFGHGTSNRVAGLILKHKLILPTSSKDVQGNQYAPSPSFYCRVSVSGVTAANWNKLRVDMIFQTFRQSSTKESHVIGVFGTRQTSYATMSSGGVSAEGAAAHFWDAVHHTREKRWAIRCQNAVPLGLATTWDRHDGKSSSVVSK